VRFETRPLAPRDTVVADRDSACDARDSFVKARTARDELADESRTETRPTRDDFASTRF
jgi:hypothetical protein